MTIELKPEDRRIVDLAIQSGACNETGDVIGTARRMLAEVEEELRALGKLK